MLFRQLIFAGGVGKRCLMLVVGLSLAAAGAASAQVQGAGVRISEPPVSDAKSVHIMLDGPPQKYPPPAYYVDGQRFDSTALGIINPNDIESIDILKGAKALQLAPDGGQWGVVIITTKAGQHTRAVRAFNRRLKQLSRRKP
ncbi:TonB-dependent receptor [Hymenobacter psoromatis]|uniref:TonB-dependent receptor n=1 Tax=Hymenobacter psoromatis TaxID=1484116 RepID=UPI001CC01682|nr:TonB-dependent receptor plug domain-containing protein [Hymenobacter psoromatis]